MVFIHGGRYLEGSASNPHLDGTTLANAGVVVVSVNYRTGVDGFAHIDGAPDNRGILDQIAALQWVQHHIADYGGDPDNVTVFGQSAGAGSVAAMLAIPSTDGLFRRAIAQSVPGTYFTPVLAKTITSAIAAQLGVQPTLDEMARIPVRTWHAAALAFIDRMPDFVESWGPVALTPTPFSPVVDGDLLPNAPWRALAGGAARKVDLIVGHTRDEYRLFATRFGGAQIDDRMMHSYRAAYPDASATELHELVNADWLFRMPSLHLAEAQHLGGGRAWMYELCWGYNRVEEASHSLDVLLIFGTLDEAEVRNHRAAHPGAAGEAVTVGHAMRADWVSFAATGDPGWPTYQVDSRRTRVYSAESTVQPYPEDVSRRIWSRYRFDVLGLS